MVNWDMVNICKRSINKSNDQHGVLDGNCTLGTGGGAVWMSMEIDVR